MSAPDRLHLFEGYGVELEYMIVDTDTLDVRPVADELIKAACGTYESEIERGPICWSNELMLHVVELKTNGPVPRLAPVAGDLQAGVRDINQFLAPMGARLMPSAMHPWMQPEREAKLWPHEYSAVFERFDQIFDCTGHGWSNLQSAHLNLPFADDAEFGRLHAAVRLVLPLLPALAASSPIAGRQRTGQMDYRLAVYRNNAAHIPSISGEVIPEAVFTEAAYRANIFERMYADITPHDPDGILQHEWLNARGAIARFDRGTIEVRVVDVQECPQADLAIAALASAVIQALTESRWSNVATQQAYASAPLVNLLTGAIRDADAAVIDDAAYLDLFGMTCRSPCTMRDLWEHLYTTLQAEASATTRDLLRPIETILQQGPLARRILAALGGNESPEAFKSVYGHLCDDLAEGRQFVPGL
jgi:gamma-glutamyl:cysteine ligase YbdK (ATP-grasp superfamily)